MRLRLLLATLTLPLLLWAMLPLTSSAQSSKREELSELQDQIDRARANIGKKRGTEQVFEF